MAKPEEHTKEELHVSYMSAVVAHAEQCISIIRSTEYGIDGSVKKVTKTDGGYDNTGEFFDYQLKATVNCKSVNGFVEFYLKKSALRKFRNYNNIIPQVLIVYDMPKDIAGRVKQTAERLTMEGVCYWCYMDDEACKSRTVRISKSQIFNASAIHNILQDFTDELNKLTGGA